MFASIIHEHAFFCQEDIASFPKTRYISPAISQRGAGIIEHLVALPSHRGCVRIEGLVRWIRIRKPAVEATPGRFRTGTFGCWYA